MTNPASRETGIESLIQKTREITNLATRAIGKLTDDFSLWGESIIPEHIAATYRNSCRNLLNVFSNFASRFNTVAKLVNFQYSDEEINQIEKLGANQIDAAAANLLTIKKQIEEDPKGKPPAVLCVICGMSNAAYRRPDGVLVVPITALKM